MARYRKQSLAAAKLKVNTGEWSKRQTVVHLLMAVNWAWPLFPFPSVPIPPWAILLPSRASFRINCPPQQKLLFPCAWLRTSLSNTNSNFPFNFLSQSPALSRSSYRNHLQLFFPIHCAITWLLPSFTFTSTEPADSYISTASTAVFTHIL